MNRNFKWRAHDGLVLCLSWSNETQNLVSGGDDCRYKVWDNQGALIFVSQEEDFSITSVEFCPKGLYIAVGGFNMLKLCHFTGVNHHHHHLHCLCFAKCIYCKCAFFICSGHTAT